MRIISGKFKGFKLQFLKSSITRPLKDSVRENVFNILTHSKKIDINIEKSTILDLYSGIGSFGLECASRGASKVTFVEKNLQAMKILEKNVTNLKISNQTKLINTEVENLDLKSKKEKYNVIFFDPPFVDKNFIKIIKIIYESKILSKNHIIVIHREKRSKDNFDIHLKILISKIYGRSKIFFCKFN